MSASGRVPTSVVGHAGASSERAESGPSCYGDDRCNLSATMSPRTDRLRRRLSRKSFRPPVLTPAERIGDHRQSDAQGCPLLMNHFIFNLPDGDRERATSFLRAKRWVVSRDERHRDALAPGDLALVFVAPTRQFVGHAELKTAFLDPMPSDSSASGPAVTGVMLGDVENWTSGVPLDVAVDRIDPTKSNPYVQANAAGFHAGVVQITVKEYDIVMSLRDSARGTTE